MQLERFVFGDSENVVRVAVHEDGEPWFVAKDVCDVLGLGQTGKALKALDDDEVTTVPLIDGMGREQKFYAISEPGLYSLILRSRKEQAREFKRWVTHEVLPTIRKTGGAYVQPGSQAEYDLSDPDTALDKLAEAVQIAKDERSKRTQLEARVEEDAPKVLIAEEFLDSQGLMGLRDAARSFSIPQNTFTGYLREWGWLDLVGQGAKAYATKQGYMENKVRLVNKGSTQKLQGKLTRKGIERAAVKLRE